VLSFVAFRNNTEQSHSPHHLLAVTDVFKLQVNFLLHQKRINERKEIFKKGFEILEKFLNSDHPKYIEVINKLQRVNIRFNGVNYFYRRYRLFTKIINKKYLLIAFHAPPAIENDKADLQSPAIIIENLNKTLCAHDYFSLSVPIDLV
jgi:hypothetical protein